jgi:8-oxo-dGTP pyrophosphatase MutT (NUDIX family)
MAFIDRIRACAKFDPRAYIPFYVSGTPVGLIKPGFASTLAAFEGVFEVREEGVDLSQQYASPEDRTAAVDAVLWRLAERGMIRGWRDEPYPVGADPTTPALMLMERAALPLFGVRAAGVHVNGFVRADGVIKMWIGRRSLQKQTAPGKLDQFVAGGRSAGHTIEETLVKEGAEEASLPESLARCARPVGAITYATEREGGLRRDVLYVFDLELPSGFQPRPNDDEIVDFYLWPIDKVIATVRDSDDFKFNCALVIIDFLIRHGLIAHEEPEYLALVKGLHAD